MNKYLPGCLAKARTVCVSLLGQLFHKNRVLDYQAIEVYKPIHPTAKYKFSQTNKTAFAVSQHMGKRLFEIQIVHLEESPHPLIFSHILLDNKGSIITGLTFLPELERRACGTFNNHAILIEISEDCQGMVILLFENMGIYRYELLQRWNANELVVDTEIKPLLNKE